MTKKEKNYFQSLLIAYHVRNTLEGLHSGEGLRAGKFPKSLTGDYTDVKVITPEREIPWNDLSRISEEEMHFLMLKIEEVIRYILLTKQKTIEKIGEKKFYDILKNNLFKNGPSWNRKDYNDYSN